MEDLDDLASLVKLKLGDRISDVVFTNSGDEPFTLSEDGLLEINSNHGLVLKLAEKIGDIQSDLRNLSDIAFVRTGCPPKNPHHFARRVNKMISAKNIVEESALVNGSLGLDASKRRPM